MDGCARIFPTFDADAQEIAGGLAGRACGGSQRWGISAEFPQFSSDPAGQFL
jgi:hypothetical protein